MSQFSSFVPTLGQSDLNVQFGILRGVLNRSNHLAKELKGYHRAQEYRTKTDLLSFLILVGLAIPNGILVNGEVGLNIFENTPYFFQLHVPPRFLHAEARAVIDSKLASLPLKCSVREHLDSRTRRNKKGGL